MTCNFDKKNKIVKNAFLLFLFGFMKMHVRVR